jgi:D-sedoheptulose 7-phosphate isomerase
MQEMLKTRIVRRQKVLEEFKENTQVAEALRIMEEAIKQGNKVLVFGNGGSATQASHFAAELVNKFYLARPGMPAVALPADTAAVTSIANDFDFKYVFSRQIEALGKADDIALGISTSGRSANVIEALKTAKRLHLKTIALCGNHTESLDGLAIDQIIAINTDDTPVIQEMHLFVLHFMAEMLEKRLFGT